MEIWADCRGVYQLRGPDLRPFWSARHTEDLRQYPGRPGSPETVRHQYPDRHHPGHLREYPYFSSAIVLRVLRRGPPHPQFQEREQGRSD